jgi:hypothetical protein
MKRYLRMVARLYPRAWQERYAQEFEALLDDVRPTWRDAGDILAGAVKMHLTTGSSYLKLTAILAVSGLILGIFASFSAPKRYVSTGVVRLETDPEAVDRFPRAVSEVLSRGRLSEIIQRPSLELYKKERARVPMADIVEDMRKDIRIGRQADGIVEVAFAYSDAAKAEATARALVNGLALATGRHDAASWQKAWPDDPPPPGQRLAVVRAPDLPAQPVRGGVRLGWPAAGIAAGLFAAWLIRRPKQNLRLVGFAVAGATVAIAVSFGIGDRYTSSAVVRMTPPEAPKRVWNVVATEPLTAHFRRLQEQVVKPEALDDIQIKGVGPDTFLLSFTDTDRYHAQRFVRGLIEEFAERNVREQLVRTKDGQLGPNFEVVDPAALPEMPVFPNRLAIGAFGLPVGLVAGVFLLRRRRGQVAGERG